MGEGIEQARPRGLRPHIEILAPAGVDVFGLPVFRAAVDVEFAEVMHAAEKEVPRIHGREFAHPVFAPGNEIDFEPELDRQLREFRLASRTQPT